MSTKQTMEMITELKNKGVNIHLTEEGWSMLIHIVEELNNEENASEEQVG